MTNSIKPATLILAAFLLAGPVSARQAHQHATPPKTAQPAPAKADSMMHAGMMHSMGGEMAPKMSNPLHDAAMTVMMLPSHGDALSLTEAQIATLTAQRAAALAAVPTTDDAAERAALFGQDNPAPATIERLLIDQATRRARAQAAIFVTAASMKAVLTAEQRVTLSGLSGSMGGMMSAGKDMSAMMNMMNLMDCPMHAGMMGDQEGMMNHGDGAMPDGMMKH